MENEMRNETQSEMETEVESEMKKQDKNEMKTRRNSPPEASFRRPGQRRQRS